MGLAFEVELGPSRLVSRIRAATRLAAASGLSVAGLQVASGPTAMLDGSPFAHALIATLLAVAAIAAVAAAWSVLQNPAPAAGGWRALIVDDDGQCRLRHLDRPEPEPVALQRAHILPGLILVALSPSAGEGCRHAAWLARTLLLGRDTMSDQQWRCLCVWLQWMSRGRHDRSNS
jgi:hypothetical protein